ncbi:MAG TPA: hypothetical protein VK327_15015 [Candidatus Paceibacterota bacterium]|nr:hypothetical protein [Candidatus Paceibacterota bacterium]
MESERKIEKLLRTLAKRRREQAGEPLELHPADRRLLQGEVRKRFRKEEVDHGVFRLFRMQPALFGLIVMAVVAVVAATFLPALSKAKHKAQLTSRRLAQSEPVEMRTVAPAAAPVPSEKMLTVQRPASPVPGSVAVSGRAPGTATASLAYDSSDRLHSQPATDMPVAVSGVGFPVDKLSDTMVPAETKQYNATGIEHPLEKGGEGSGRFFHKVTLFSGTAALTNALVFDAVAVDQNGSHVRLTDNGGRVFEGYLQDEKPGFGGLIAGIKLPEVSRSPAWTPSSNAPGWDLESYYWLDRDGTNHAENGNALLIGRFFFTNAVSLSGGTNGAFQTNAGLNVLRGFYLLPPKAEMRSSGLVATGRVIRIRLEPALNGK